MEWGYYFCCCSVGYNLALAIMFKWIGVTFYVRGTWLIVDQQLGKGSPHICVKHNNITVQTLNTTNNCRSQLKTLQGVSDDLCP